MIYLLLNLCTAAAYILFRAGESLSRLKYQTKLRWGQGLLGFSLLMPIALMLVPRQTASQLSSQVLMPLPEASESLAKIQEVKESVVEWVENPRPSPTRFEWPLREITVGMWALGIVFLLSRKGRSAWSVRQLVRRSIGVRQYGRVRISASSDVRVPFSTLLGGQTHIVVPESMVARWSDYKLAVKHEIQHHRHRDTLWAIAIDVVTPFFFPNPFIYLWKNRISEIQELACDEALIGRKVSTYDYGSCLVRVAEAALENGNVMVGTASMAAGFENPRKFKSFLRRRIEMLTQHHHRKPRRAAGLLLGTLTVISTAVFAVGADQVLGTNDKVTSGIVAVNSDIQKIADKALEAALARHRASLGFVVVSDPQTGKILAVANKDLTVESEAERSPHWALSLRVGPASIIKAIVAAAAVEKGVTTVDETHNCEKKKFIYGGKLYQDWKAFDTLTTAQTVQQSSNICGVKVGMKLGAESLSQSLKDFGFGPGGSAENVPEARVGEIPAVPAPEGDNALYIGTVSSGYGGIFTSPVEIIQAFGAIANGGNLLKVQAGKQNGKPVIVRRVISEETSRQMKEVLAGVMTEGTAKESGSKLYRLAGKTATGYSHSHVEHDSLGGESNFASFVGFGPVENPRVVIYVGVENPTDKHGVHGSYHAAPLFKEVAEKTLQYLKVAAN